MTEYATKNRIFLSPPHMSGEEIRFVREAFESNYVAPLGPMVDVFEYEFADKVEIPHALALSSGTAAMPRLNTPQLNKSIKAFNGVNPGEICLIARDRPRLNRKTKAPVQ